MKANGVKGLEELAEVVGVSYATVKRFMGGHQQPSPVFIAGLHLRLDLPFDLIVEAVEPHRLKATA